MTKEYLNKNEAAEFMGVSLDGFKNLCKRYHIPSAKVPGSRIIYRSADLRELNERHFNAGPIVL